MLVTGREHGFTSKFIKNNNTKYLNITHLKFGYQLVINNINILKLT